MRKSILLFLLSFIGSFSFAQTIKECFYHFHFNQWEWDYCRYAGYDTVPAYDRVTGEIYGDTVVWNDDFTGVIGNHWFWLDYPLTDSIINSLGKITVASCDEKRKFEVEKIIIFIHAKKSASFSITNEVVREEDLKRLKNYRPPYTLKLQVKLKSIDGLLQCPLIIVDK